MAVTRKIGKKRVLIILAAAVGVIITGWLYRGKNSSSISSGGESTYTVARQDMTISVVESGSIKASNSVTIRSGVEGRTTIVSVVPEGTVLTEEDVKNGRIILELDTSSQKEDLNRQQIEYNTAMADVTEAKENLGIQKNQNESDIQQGRLTVKFALMDLQKYVGQTTADKLVKKHRDSTVTDEDFTVMTKDPNQLGGESMQKLRQLQSDIDLAVEEFRRAQSDLGWTEKLYNNKYVSRSELEADQLKAKRTEIAANQAKTALDLFVQYEFPKDAHKYLSDFVEAERQLERILATARSMQAQAEAKLNSAEAKFTLEKERLEKLQRQVTAGVIRAPSAGMVVYATQFGRGSRSRTSIEVGREVMEREEILSIPSANEMAVDAKIHETNIDKIGVGQRARIIVDAMPDTAFYGSVRKIAPLPDPTMFMSNPDLKVYTTELSLIGGEMLRPGMSAKVEIIIAQLQNVLVVPVQCVSNRAGMKICYVHTRTGNTECQVKTGPYNDKFVQILEGLSEGDKVLLNPPRVYEQPQPQQMPMPEETPDVKNAAAGEQMRPEGNPSGNGPQPEGQMDSQRPRRMRPDGQAPTDEQQQQRQSRRQRNDDNTGPGPDGPTRPNRQPENNTNSGGTAQEEQP